MLRNLILLPLNPSHQELLLTGDFSSPSGDERDSSVQPLAKTPDGESAAGDVQCLSDKPSPLCEEASMLLSTHVFPWVAH